jgi:hypothetical protein
MTNPTDIPPRDIPDDLVVFALIGGPWSFRVLYAVYLLRYVASLLAPWRPGAVLEVRRKIVEDMPA